MKWWNMRRFTQLASSMRMVTWVSSASSTRGGAGDPALEEARICVRGRPARLAQAFVGCELCMAVMAQAPRLVVPDVLQLRALGQDLEQLVGLFLVLDHGERDLRVLEDVDHLLGDRV